MHAIRSADFFIPLVSKNFKLSEYTDQETGCAVCMNKKIIPIKLDTTNPYGFINKYQALQYKMKPRSSPQWYYKPDNLNEIALSVATIGLHYQPNTIYYKKSLNSLVYAFCNSGSFEISNATIRILSKCNHQLTKEHITQIMKSIAANSQIIGAYGLGDLKNMLTTRYHCRID